MEFILSTFRVFFHLLFLLIKLLFMDETNTLSIRVQCNRAVWTSSIVCPLHHELWFGDWFRSLYIQWTCIPVPVLMLKQLIHVIYISCETFSNFQLNGDLDLWLNQKLSHLYNLKCTFFSHFFGDIDYVLEMA